MPNPWRSHSALVGFLLARSLPEPRRRELTAEDTGCGTDLGRGVSVEGLGGGVVGAGRGVGVLGEVGISTTTIRDLGMGLFYKLF